MRGRIGLRSWLTRSGAEARPVGPPARGYGGAAEAELARARPTTAATIQTAASRTHATRTAARFPGGRCPYPDGLDTTVELHDTRRRVMISHPLPAIALTTFAPRTVLPANQGLRPEPDPADLTGDTKVTTRCLPTAVFLGEPITVRKAVEPADQHGAERSACSGGLHRAPRLAPGCRSSGRRVRSTRFGRGAAL